MKITNNQIQHIRPQKLEVKNSVSTMAATVAVSQDSSNVAKSTSINKINTMQQEHIQTQQLFGALTQLTEAIELFRQQPSAYEQNVKAMIEKAQKDFPSLTKHSESLKSDDIMADIDKIRQELTQKLSSEKKAIAFYLITEQNKDAVQKNPQHSVPDKNTIANSGSQAHTSRVEQITKLLS